MTRQCGSCTKCCDGWLTANVYGHEMKPGTPCFFRGDNKCSIYSDRPKVCSEFQCGWLMDDGTRFDEWMRPNNVNFILVYFRHGDIEWYKLAEAGEVVNPLMLSYLIQEVIRKNLNLEYWIRDAQFLIGSNQFKKYVKK